MEALNDSVIAALVERELANRRWELAGEPSLFASGDSFARRVSARVAQWAAERGRARDATLVREAFTHEYCLLLHAAVGLHGSRVQARALEETFAYGFPIARRRLDGTARAEEVTWGAVLKMWRAVAGTGRMGDPGSYLSYFARVLLNEIGQEYRRLGRIDTHEQPFDAPDAPGEEESPRDEATADPGAPDPAQAVEVEEARAEFWQALRDCLGNSRREYILVANVILGFNGSEIARQLKTTVQAVHMAKHHAIAHIKEQCADLLARLLGDLKALRAESVGRA